MNIANTEIHMDIADIDRYVITIIINKLIKKFQKS